MKRKSRYRKHKNPPPMGYTAAAAALGVSVQHFWKVWNRVRTSHSLMQAYKEKFEVKSVKKPDGKNRENTSRTSENRPSPTFKKS